MMRDPSSQGGRPSGIAGGRIDVGSVTPVDGGPQPSAMRADGTMAAEPVIPVARFAEARGHGRDRRRPRYGPGGGKRAP